MSSAVVGTHSGAGPLSLMSCVRESSPLQDYEPSDNEKNAATKKKFWNPKKWFKRKNKAQEDAVVPVEIIEKDVIRSRSTSELSITDDQIRRRSGSSMIPGLSVSHDSVFHSPNSGSDIEIDVAHSSSSLSISQPQIDVRLQTELSERLRSRRGRGDTSEDDEGLPHSPCNSPTTTEAPTIEKTAIKDLPPKSHSTCSDGSLLSMGSSEMDEESFSQSRHSSKLSLHERHPSDQDSDLELGSSSSIQVLNHSAAHHRVSVRPKRRAPHRSKRVPQLSNALPTTPEVNEDSSIRSMTPENVTKETITEYSMSTRTTLTETQMKCSSLPPGLAAPGGLDPTAKLNRSRSNAGQEFIEEDVEKEEKTDKSFFDRIFPRRSAKKRKSKEEKTVTVTVSQTQTKQSRIESKPIAAPRSGAAARQRIQPIDLPPSPEKDFDLIMPKPSPEKMGTSPLQQELENRFKQRLNSVSLTPPPSPKMDKVVSEPAVITSRVEEVRKESRSEEIKSKMKIPGLSSLQQRVLLLNDEVDDGGFKSLSSLPADVNVAKPVAKSHSFKGVKPATFQQPYEFIIQPKAASLDLDDSKNFLEKEIIENEKTTEVVNEIIMDSSESSSKFLEVSEFSDFSNITISGPSHTAVVNVTSNSTDSYNAANTKTEIVNSGDRIKEVTTKESVSVTKIQLKRESTQITQSTVTVPKTSVPEFFNRQLNRVEKPASNVVFSMNTPRIVDEQARPKPVLPVLDIDKTKMPRKFSQEDIEIVEKSEEEEETKTSTLIAVVSQPRFRKNETHKRKSSGSSTTPDNSFQNSRSQSLDSLKADESSDRSSQDSLDKLDEKTEEKKESKIENVVLRKRSLIKQRNDDEPELMKVFARRSLKLKDTESEAVSQQVATMVENANDAKTRDSDKENQEDSPKEERKKSITKLKEPLNESKIIKKEEITENQERKIVEAEVQLRRPSNNFYARAFSVTAPKATETEKVKKQPSFCDRRKTDNWITNMKNGDDLIERKISQDEIITGISPKSDFISEDLLTERKNFNQRKAEWEKRAQEAQKKSVP